MPDLQRPLFQQQRNEPCFCGSGLRFKSCCGSLNDSRLPPHGVHRAPRFLMESECQAWLEYLEEQPRRPLSVNQASNSNGSDLSLQRDPGRVTDVVSQGRLAGPIEALVKRAFLHEVSSTLGRDLAWMEAPQVLRYEPGGLYGPHADSDHFNSQTGTWHKVLDRDASLLIYLNQDFTGGELGFPQFNYRYKPAAGELLFFPSHGHYAHQALPVNSGVRYVIVSWAAFREQVRVQARPPEGYIELS